MLTFFYLSVFVSLVATWEGVLPQAVVIEGVIYRVNVDESLTSTYGGGTVLTLDDDTGILQYFYANGTVAYTAGIGDDKGKLYKGDGTTGELVTVIVGYLDSKGNVVDKNDIKIFERPVAVVIEDVIYSFNRDDESYVAADGTVLTPEDDTGTLQYYKGGTVAYTASDNKGKIYKGDGTSGEEVSYFEGYLDSKGNVVSEDNKVEKSVFGPYRIVIEGVFYSLNRDDESLVAADGTVLTPEDDTGVLQFLYKNNGTVAYTGCDVRGKLYKGDGTTKKLVPTFWGYLDSEGNIVNRDGKHQKGLEVVVIDGVVYTVNDGDILEAADGTVLTVGEGDNLYKDDKIAYTHGIGDGKLYKGDGTKKEEVSAQGGFLIWNGNVVNDEGNIIYWEPKKNDFAVVIEGVIYTQDGDKNLVAASGTTVLVYGDGGNLYYKDSSTIAYTFGEDGKLYKGNDKKEISYTEGALDGNGNVVDDKGNIIAQGNAGNAGNKTLVPTLLVVLILALLV